MWNFVQQQEHFICWQIGIWKVHVGVPQWHWTELSGSLGSYKIVIILFIVENLRFIPFKTTEIVVKFYAKCFPPEFMEENLFAFVIIVQYVGI